MIEPARLTVFGSVVSMIIVQPGSLDRFIAHTSTRAAEFVERSPYVNLPTTSVLRDADFPRTVMPLADVAGLIARLPAFADLDDTQRAAVVALTRVEQVAAGTTLFRESEPADDLRFIVDGRVSLGMRFGGRGEVIVLSLGPGELIGWTALLGGAWTATARAVERSILVRLPGAVLAALCEREHDIGYALMKHLFAAMALRLHDTRLQLLDMFGKEPC